jgi:hypothetical protein
LMAIGWMSEPSIWFARLRAVFFAHQGRQNRWLVAQVPDVHCRLGAVQEVLNKAPSSGELFVVESRRCVCGRNPLPSQMSFKSENWKLVIKVVSRRLHGGSPLHLSKVLPLLARRRFHDNTRSARPDSRYRYKIFFTSSEPYGKTENIARSCVSTHCHRGA